MNSGIILRGPFQNRNKRLEGQGEEMIKRTNREKREKMRRRKFVKKQKEKTLIFFSLSDTLFYITAIFQIGSWIEFFFYIWIKILIPYGTSCFFNRSDISVEGEAFFSSFFQFCNLNFSPF